MRRTRTKLAQELHDWVIDKTIEKQYGDIIKAGNEVHKNPNFEQNYPVDSFYPDIVVFNPKRKKVTLIDEIETEVGDPEYEQWSDYAKLDTKFIVTVPLSELDNAKKALKTIKIAEIWTYETEYPKEKTITFRKEYPQQRS